MKRLLWFGMVWLAAFSMKAQSDVAFTNYWALQSFYNPAASGLDGKLTLQGAYSMQMMGYEHAPATMLVGVDMPVYFLSPRHGAGVGFMNDKIGLFTHKKIYLQYAYHQPLKGGRFSFGLRGALLTEDFDGTKVDVDDKNDAIFSSSQVDGTAFDFDAGLRYTYKDKWYAGLSAMHILSPKVRMGDDKVNELNYSPNFYATAGYTFRFPRRKEFVLYTSGILRTDLTAWRGDITARMAYNGEKFKMYGGVTYSPMTSVGILVGTTFQGINVGYSYEMYTGGVGALNGTHEIVIGYSTDLNLFKKGKNKHQSVRIL